MTFAEPKSRQYTWHSNTKPVISCRLDYFLISNHISHLIKRCAIRPSYKSDHSLVSIAINLTNQQRGPGYFKFNNSLLTEDNFICKIKEAIDETIQINKEANPNILWELIKGNIRNNTI